METWKKIVLFFSCIVVICIAFLTAITYQSAIGNYIVDMPDHDLLIGNDFIARLIIVFNGVVFIIFLIMLLVILCYPKKITKLKFKKNNGAILIDRKAIKGFMLSSLKEEKSIKNPSIQIKMRKKKIKVSIKGKIGVTSDIYGRTKDWEDKMEEQIKLLIGSEVGIKTKVILKGYAEKEIRGVS